MMTFFFNDPATTEIYTLSLSDALPIWEYGALIEPLAVGYHAARNGRLGSGDAVLVIGGGPIGQAAALAARRLDAGPIVDRKSTRLNSSHANISYAVFCLKKNTCPACASPVVPRKRLRAPIVVSRSRSGIACTEAKPCLSAASRNSAHSSGTTRMS